MNMNWLSLWLIWYWSFVRMASAFDLNYGNLHYTQMNPPTEFPITNEFIIAEAITSLHSITNATDLNECVSCKMRLQLGKYIALLRPELVPVIFQTWCRELGVDDVKCHTNFGYPSVHSSTLGNDFTKMLQLISPTGLDGDLFCYYHDHQCGVVPELPKLNQMSTLWPPKPMNYHAPTANTGEPFNVLHISDLNLQTDYLTMAESNCSQSTCCTAKNYNHNPPPSNYDYSSLHDSSLGLSFYDSSYETGHFQKGQYLDLYASDQYSSGQKPWLPAHEFGSYSCDSPHLLINNTLQVIRDFHENHLNFEFGIFTGGMNDRESDLFVDKAHVTNSHVAGYNSVYTYLDKFPIYPTFGVTDTFPSGQLPPNDVDSTANFQWQYDLLADIWTDFDWIDDRAAKQLRYNKIGYSVVTKHGLKIISLNSNVWNVHNLYGFIHTLEFDPFGIWQFLIDELIDSEVNEQRCWIIGHLPPSSHALPVPAKVFSQIIERFSPKVIAAIFFGYTLQDQFNMIYAGDGTTKDLQSVVNHVLLGPSVSPYRGNNPAWRYYSVDSETFNIINSFTYYTKLNHTFINGGAEPIWEFEYSARDIYDPDHLWPMDRSLDTEFWHHVSEKIRDSAQFNQLYTNLESRLSPLGPDSDDNYCKVSSFTVWNRKQCMETEDQDDYIEPEVERTFIPIIKPYQPPEYELYLVQAPKVNDYIEPEYRDPFDGDVERVPGPGTGNSKHKSVKSNQRSKASSIRKGIENGKSQITELIKRGK